MMNPSACNCLNASRKGMILIPNSSVRLFLVYTLSRPEPSGENCLTNLVESNLADRRVALQFTF